MSQRRIAIALLVLLSAGIAVFLWHHEQRLQPSSLATGPVPDVPDVNAGRKNPFLPVGAPDCGWPFIRGVNFDGHSPEIHLADAWPKVGPPVLWHRPLGQGYSSFTAAGNRVFTQYQTLSGQYVACLDADTGTTVWEYHYDWPYEAGGLYPGPRATPTLYDGRVYFTAPSGLVGCLTWDGSLVWQVAAREKFAGKGADFGYSCSPTVVDGLVILPVGGRGASLVALDARNGSTRWHGGDDSASYTPALPISIAGHKQVIGYFENALACFDQSDGRLLWRMDLSQGYDEHAAWPIFVEPRLWIAAPFKWGSSLLDLSAAADSPPATAWHGPLLSNDVFSSVSHEGSVYGFDLKDVQAKSHRASRGVFRCLDFETGAAKWDSDKTGHCSVLVADDKLILFNDQGELIAARAKPDRYEELARASVLTGEICWTPPALDRGRLFVRNQKHAACVYIGNPALLELDATSKSLSLAEIPQGTYYNLAAIMGVEPEYAMDVPSRESLVHWFFVGLNLLGVAYLIAVFTKLTSRLVWPKRMRDTGTRRIFWGSAFVLGCVATTPLSLRRGEFVFTWPVALFVMFQMTVEQVRLKPPATGEKEAEWPARLVVLNYLGFCVLYFVLCRRLSLAFEWVFLAGFPAALVPALASRWLSPRFRWPIVVEIAFTVCGFASYFWASVALLWWKYPTGQQ